MSLENCCEKQSQSLHELVLSLLMVLLDSARRHDLTQIRDKVGVQLLNFGVVFRVHALWVDSCDLCQALQRVAAELLLREELVQKHVNQRSFEDVVQRDPEEEPESA